MLHLKVSCLVVTYNQQDFIEETLQSLLAQEYDNCEIIVSDDDSSDATPDILERYQKQFPEKIKIITRQKHLGITRNVNRALALCTGDYVGLIGGDDLWLPQKITKQIQWFSDNPSCIVCYHDVEAFDSETRKTLYKFSDYNPILAGTAGEIIYAGCFAAACSVLIHRKDIPNLKFEDGIPHASDWFFVLEALLKTGKKIGFMGGIHALYRRHKNSVTAQLDLNEEYLDGYKILEKRYPSYKKEIAYAYQYHLLGMVLSNLRRFKLLKAYKIFSSIDLNKGYAINILCKRIKERLLG